MDKQTYQRMVQMETRAKYGPQKELVSKSIPRYPKSAEREFQRVSRAYMKLLRDALKKHLPAIMEICRQEREDSRYDTSAAMEQRIRLEIQKIMAELEDVSGKFGLDEYVEKVASLTNASSIREWRRAVRKTLGIDILSDYYKGEIYEEALKRWTADNVNLIKTIPAETLDSMQQIILDGYRQGRSIRQMQKDIQAEYDVKKRKAELLARDQVASLNASITQLQQRDAGVKRYEWSTSKDSRVRDCHRELHGKVISWDDPPEMWYMTKSKGIVYTGRRCHPGEDYACRCVAIPVFDWETTNVPINGGQSDDGKGNRKES